MSVCNLEQMVMDVWSEEAPDLSYEEVKRARRHHKMAIDKWDELTFRKFLKGRVEHRDEDYTNKDWYWFIQEGMGELIDLFNYLMSMYPHRKESNKGGQS